MYFSTKQSLKRLAVFMSDAESDQRFGDTVTHHLIEGLANSGVQVELLVLDGQNQLCGHFSNHTHISIKKLRANCEWLAIPELKRYLQNHPGQVMLAAENNCIQAASMANLLAGLKGNVAGLMCHTNWQEGTRHFSPRWRFGIMRMLYRYTSGVITLSADIGQTLQLLAVLPHARIKQLSDPCKNEVVTRGYLKLLTEWQRSGICSVTSGRYLSA